MAELQGRDTCARHPDETAVARCDHCSNPACAKCAVEALGLKDLYCSRTCARTGSGETLDRLIEAGDRPFRTGARVWARSLPDLVLYALPVTVAATAAVAVSATAGNIADTSSIASLVGVGLMIYGIALTGTLLSDRYTGLVHGNAYWWTLRQIPIWVATWVLAIVAVTIGYFLLIVPGIILSIRLFWADEYALVHDVGPIDALRASWTTTDGEALSVFSFSVLAGLLGWVLFMSVVLLFTIIPAYDPSEVNSMGLAMRVFFVFTMTLTFYGLLHATALAKLYGMRAAYLRRLGDEE